MRRALSPGRSSVTLGAVGNTGLGGPSIAGLPHGPRQLRSVYEPASYLGLRSRGARATGRAGTRSREVAHRHPAARAASVSWTQYRLERGDGDPKSPAPCLGTDESVGRKGDLVQPLAAHHRFPLLIAEAHDCSSAAALCMVFDEAIEGTHIERPEGCPVAIAARACRCLRADLTSVGSVVVADLTCALKTGDGQPGLRGIASVAGTR
jgi:hypothetical protein